MTANVGPAQAIALVQTFIGTHGPATVSQLRQVLGSSRRVAVPLLEYLDRTFVTLRQGDKRRLRRGLARVTSASLVSTSRDLVA